MSQNILCWWENHEHEENKKENVQKTQEVFFSRCCFWSIYLQSKLCVCLVNDLVWWWWWVLCCFLLCLLLYLQLWKLFFFLFSICTLFEERFGANKNLISTESYRRFWDQRWRRYELHRFRLYYWKFTFRTQSSIQNS